MFTKFNPILVLAIIILSLFVGCSPDDKDDSPTFQEIWYPMEVGHQWKYSSSSTDTTIIIVTTIVGEIELNGTRFFINRNDFPNSSYESYALYLHVDKSGAWFLFSTDTIQICKFPFVDDKWLLLHSHEYRNSEDEFIGRREDFVYTTAHHSVEVPAGLIEDCWKFRRASIIYDSMSIVVDTSMSDDPGTYLANDVGMVRYNYDNYLVSFETDVDVDSLYILPESDAKSSREYDRLGRVIFDESN